MSTDMQTRRPSALSRWVSTEDAQRKIAAAVGDTIPPEQFISHMLVALEQEKVRDCSDASKSRVLMECAAVALLPTLHQVALIPRKTEVTVMIQWQGFKALMERHPDILEVVGVLVHNNDELSIHEGELHHCFDPLDERRNIDSPEDLRGGYLKIVYRDGRPPKYHFVRRKTIKQAAGCAKTDDMWNKWYYEMALKTLYRNAYARRAVPIDPIVGARIERALNIEDVQLGNDPARIVSDSTLDHIEQARQVREIKGAVENEDEHREPQEPADASQVDPAVEAADGVDAPEAEGPSREEIFERLKARVRKLRTTKSIQDLTEEGYGLLDGELRESFLKIAAERLELIGKKDQKPTEKPADGELFPTGATATEQGQ